jgi:hypothetical protein
MAHHLAHTLARTTLNELLITHWQACPPIETNA